MKNYFELSFEKSIKTKKKCVEQGFSSLYKISKIILDSFKSGGKLMICGNGGSASDAQHLVAELLVRLRPEINRDPIPALFLAQDTSTITACGNDYSFNDLFSRNIDALGNKGDSLLAISTSGNSKNIINAITSAKKKDIKVCAFLGKGGGSCVKLCDESFIVPSNDTAAIQESHITAGHALMELIEDNFLK
jgi:D-sedoheptulose 7-phosphate isomerase